MTKPLPGALRDAADAVASMLTRMDQKLDMLLAQSAADAAADRTWPAPPKPKRNGHAAGGKQ
ncbi:hypothetical protein [Acidiphilium acidophilum]|uniref:hypothetical protein n=1 Tax=Acidiphilium acidophilum TaxID=76588 RepID=UPI002E8E71B8|nr:hypothetical protein [Acidiphilium acidophilum]